MIEAARRGEDLDKDEACYMRVIEYEVPDRKGDEKGELIALIITITKIGASRVRPGARATVNPACEVVPPR